MCYQYYVDGSKLLFGNLGNRYCMDVPYVSLRNFIWLKKYVPKHWFIKKMGLKKKGISENTNLG